MTPPNMTNTVQAARKVIHWNAVSCARNRGSGPRPRLDVGESGSIAVKVEPLPGVLSIARRP
jgi:hypothetical protein